MKDLAGVIGDSCSLSFLVLVDLVASALPCEEESCPFQGPYRHSGGYPWKPLGHTATSNEVKLTDSGWGISSQLSILSSM